MLKSSLKMMLYAAILVVLAVFVAQYLSIRSINRTLDETLLPVFSVGAEIAETDAPAQPVIFVGNNWQGTITVIDPKDYAVLGVINGIPDKKERLQEVKGSFVRRLLFYGIRNLVGEGNNQYVDDMYSSLDGRSIVVSRPSFADVVSIDIETGRINWRFEVDGARSDHMALSPDGKHVAVSASTGNVVHVINVGSGEEAGRFPTGDSPHENVYSKDGSKIFHASIGRVFSPFDFSGGGFLKGERRFQVVDAKTMAIIEQFDIRDKLDEFGREDVSPSIRPMAHTSDERFFYFQLSFLHGFIEYDMQSGKIVRLVDLPKVTSAKRTGYVNDSAHHGIAISGDDTTLCVAGTMDDYVAIVDIASTRSNLLEGIGKKPYWVVTDKKGEYCYVSWSETDQMSVIRYADGMEVARVNVGDHPQRIREGFVTGRWYAASKDVPDSEPGISGT